MELNASTLGQMAEGLRVPDYDRDRVTVGIVHLGVGGFHRSHQAVYIDTLLQGGYTEWGICGVGVLDGDRRMAKAMQDQDGLYTLLVKSPDGEVSARIIGSIVRYLFAPDDPEAVLEQLAQPATRIVSLTITEGGYGIDPVTGDFSANDPAVQGDLTPGVVPRTAFGLVVEALARRRAHNIPPFTVVSCDNIPGNGGVARRSLAGFASLRDPALGECIRASVSFPDSMVDRITPMTLDEDRANLSDQFGVEDQCPVVCEPYTQWVLQDAFGSGRPRLEEVGVQVVEDVEPYELMKLRLLNGSHQALAYFGYLAGYRLVHQVCEDALFIRFLSRYMEAEVAPTLPPVPGVDLSGYQSQLLQRFANPQVGDTVARLCAETSDRIPNWVVPVARQQVQTGGPLTLSAAIVASWARYAEGVDQQGRAIEVVDRLHDQVSAAAKSWADDPLAFLRQCDLFADLVYEPRFVGAYSSALDALHHDGARATLEGLLSNG